MIDFPKIKAEQVAVIIADAATGHVLMLSGELYNRDTGVTPYMIFNSVEIAKDFIQDFIKNKNTLEFVVYDYKQNVIYTSG